MLSLLGDDRQVVTVLFVGTDARWWSPLCLIGNPLHRYVKCQRLQLSYESYSFLSTIISKIKTMIFTVVSF